MLGSSSSASTSVLLLLANTCRAGVPISKSGTWRLEKGGYKLIQALGTLLWDKDSRQVRCS